MTVERRAPGCLVSGTHHQLTLWVSQVEDRVGGIALDEMGVRTEHVLGVAETKDL